MWHGEAWHPLVMGSLGSRAGCRHPPLGAASAVADAPAPSDDEVSGPAAASPSDVGLSAAVALGAESVAFESPESQGPEFG